MRCDLRWIRLIKVIMLECGILCLRTPLFSYTRCLEWLQLRCRPSCPNPITGQYDNIEWLNSPCHFPVNGRGLDWPNLEINSNSRTDSTVWLLLNYTGLLSGTRICLAVRLLLLWRYIMATPFTKNCLQNDDENFWYSEKLRVVYKHQYILT